MKLNNYIETRVPLVAALATLVRHEFDDFHRKGQTVDCLNQDGSYVRIHVGDTKGYPLEDHAKPDGSWRYPPESLFVIAYQFLPEYIKLGE